MLKTICPSMIFQTRLAPQCAMHALPFIHSLSGRDTTSYSFGTGTKTRLVTAKSLDTSVWCSLSKMKNHTKLQWESQIKQGNFFIAVYMYKGKPDEFTELSNLRVHKFLNNRSTRFTLLPLQRVRSRSTCPCQQGHHSRILTIWLGYGE